MRDTLSSSNHNVKAQAQCERPKWVDYTVKAIGTDTDDDGLAVHYVRLFNRPSPRLLNTSRLHCARSVVLLLTYIRIRREILNAEGVPFFLSSKLI